MANEIIGPSTGRSQVQQLHDFLLSDIGQIPQSTGWVLQIDQIPIALQTNLSDQTRGLELGNWGTAQPARDIINALEQGLFFDNTVCIFAHGTQTPREGANAMRIGMTEHTGGLLGAPVITGRQTMGAELNIAFLETNYSFLDLIVRPWVIYTEHYGLIARTLDDPKNIKTTLQVYYYDRNGKARKIFRYYNAAPVTVESLVTTWDVHDVKPVYTAWTYTHYDITTQVGVNIPNSSRPDLANVRSFLPSLGQIKNPFDNLGSKLLSNPIGYKLADAAKTVSGAITGGSYTGNLALGGILGR